MGRSRSRQQAPLPPAVSRQDLHCDSQRARVSREGPVSSDGGGWTKAVPLLCCLTASSPLRIPCGQWREAWRCAIQRVAFSRDPCPSHSLQADALWTAQFQAPLWQLTRAALASVLQLFTIGPLLYFLFVRASIPFAVSVPPFYCWLRFR